MFVRLWVLMPQFVLSAISSKLNFFHIASPVVLSQLLGCSNHLLGLDKATHLDASLLFEEVPLDYKTEPVDNRIITPHTSYFFRSTMLLEAR